MSTNFSFRGGTLPHFRMLLHLEIAFISLTLWGNVALTLEYTTKMIIKIFTLKLAWIDKELCC